MSYREVKKAIEKAADIESRKTLGSKYRPVFADIVGETEIDGELYTFFQEFKSSSKYNNQRPTGKRKKYPNTFHEFEEVLLTATATFKREADSKKSWITYMGLLERAIVQLKWLDNPNLAFTLQKQKSGDNVFTYIIVRAPFVNLFEGKIELRIYYKRMEDFPDYKNIEDLKQNWDFYQDAEYAMKEEMKKHIDSNPISITQILDKLKEIGKINAAEIRRIKRESGKE